MTSVGQRRPLEDLLAVPGHVPLGRQGMWTPSSRLCHGERTVPRRRCARMPYPFDRIDRPTTATVVVTAPATRSREPVAAPVSSGARTGPVSRR